MRKQIFRNAISLVTLLLGLFMTTPATAHKEAKGASLEAFLRSDGSIKPDGNFRGTLDLENWNVQLDPLLGPIFTPIAAQDNWAAIGAGGGPFKGEINAVAVMGTDVYVGGWFENAGGVPEADYIAKWNGSRWEALSNGGSGEPALSSSVSEMLVIGSDLYVAGWGAAKDTNGNLIANAASLAKWNGTAWSAVPGMTANLNNAAEALAYDSANHILYVGGTFTNANGIGAADYAFGIDLDTNSTVTLGSNGASDGSLNNGVYALGVDSLGNVYAGGFFINVNNGGTTLAEADFAAKWDGTNWSNLGNNGAGNGALSSLVGSIAVDASNNVYVGGWFSNAGGVATADFIAKWNGSTWSGLGSDGAGNGALLASPGGNPVQDIVINGTDIYVSGFFVGSSGIPEADYVARFDTVGGTWFALGNNGAGNGALNHGGVGMAFSGGNLYVGGTFADVNNGGTILPTADYFAVWNGTNWFTLGESNGVFNYIIYDMAVLGSDVYVGGNFANLGGDQRIDYLARWDGSEWHPVGNLTQGNGSVNSTVFALAVDGTDLYVGGQFTQVENEGTVVSGAVRIAKWNGATWSALGSGVNSTVNALAVDSNHHVYVGGHFTNVNSIAEADYIAKWDGSAWSALAGNGSGNGAISSGVNAIAVNGTDVYVGGGFASVVNTSNALIPNASYLAKWNGSSWAAMDGITAPPSGSVYCILVSGSDVYVGGQFGSLNGIAAAGRIAKWDGTSWSALGSDGIGGSSLNYFVDAIAVDGSRVYVGGGFTNVINVDSTTLHTADYIAVWDGTNWSSMGSNGAGEGALNREVHSLMIVNDDLWVGGAFENASNNGTEVKEADYLAAYGLDVPPTITSILRVHATPVSHKTAQYTVTFSESMTGVDVNDFLLTQTGNLSGASVASVSGSGAIYTVTVNTGIGDGTLRLDIPSSATMTDATLNPLGGLPYTGGEVYVVDRMLLAKSNATEDGWILESAENSNAGGSMDSAATTLRLGDDVVREQYRGILSFSTSGLPDNAVITKVTLKVRRQSVTGGGNPVNILQGFMLDLRKGTFGTSALQLSDWQANANKTVGPFTPTLTSGWYTFDLTSSKAYINKLATSSGLTQIRLRFQLDDNNNFAANFLSLFSGNAGAGSRPQLIIEFHVP